MQMMRIALVLLLVVAPCEGQPRSLPSIKGVVRDSVTGRPIEHVNVYLSSTTFGVGTDGSGRYNLSGAQPGRFELVFSRVGYVTKVLQVELRNAAVYVRDVTLAPRLIAMGDVEVSADAAQEWHRNYVSFARIFLGEGPNAQKCEIKNPDVLTFTRDPDTHVLEARASEPLIVSNKGLGYELQLSLAEFHWDTKQDYGYFLVRPFFKQLPFRDQQDSLLWGRNREEAYKGSLRHFLLAMADGTVDSSGFVIHKGDLAELQSGHGRYMFPDEIQIQSLASGLKRWTCDGWLRIDQKGESELHASYIQVEHAGALIDPAGSLDDPLSVKVLGRWSRERVADMLPVNYEEPEHIASPTRNPM